MRTVVFCAAVVGLVACNHSSKPDIGIAVIDASGAVRASNDHPFPVLSASKIIPAAMAIDERRSDLMPLVRKSVIASDNDAADRLTERLGGKAAVQRWMKSKGLRPYFTATEAEMVANPFAMTAKPSELALTLYRIKSRRLIELMAQTKTGNDRIRAAYRGAPHKSGTSGDDLVDVGLVNGQVIAVMGTSATPAELATEAARPRGDRTQRR